MKNVPAILRKHQSKISELDPYNQESFAYRKSHWEKRFWSDEDFAYLSERYPKSISRRNVAEIAGSACEFNDIVWIRRLFLATMVWGYGAVGYGPYRTAKMLAADGSARVLEDVFSLASTGYIVDAYQRLSLPWCGPVFSTKFLYFIGLGCQLDPLPVILDSVVSNKLEQWIGLDTSEISRGAVGYLKYIRLMSEWAEELSCRPDSIELFLFDYSGEE